MLVNYNENASFPIRQPVTMDTTFWLYFNRKSTHKQETLVIKTIISKSTISFLHMNSK